MTKLRWQQRYDNFDKALDTLHSARDAFLHKPDDNLYAIALIGAFKFTYELGWKTLKDYLKFNGITVNLPREVIKYAFHHNLIEDGQTWINMLEDRNLLSHAYDASYANQAVQHITRHYITAIEQVHRLLKKQY